MKQFWHTKRIKIVIEDIRSSQKTTAYLFFATGALPCSQGQIYCFLVSVVMTYNKKGALRDFSSSNVRSMRLLLITYFASEFIFIYLQVKQVLCSVQCSLVFNYSRTRYDTVSIIKH